MVNTDFLVGKAGQSKSSSKVSKKSASSTDFDGILKSRDVRKKEKVEFTRNAEVKNGSADKNESMGRNINNSTKTDKISNDKDRKNGIDCVKNNDSSEFVSEKTEVLYKETVKVISDELNLSEEEIAAKMSELGILPSQLFRGGNLALLVSNLTASENPMNLLLDNTMSTSLKNIMDAVDLLKYQFAVETGLDIGKVSDLMNDIIMGDTADVEAGAEAGVGVETDGAHNNMSENGAVENKIAEDKSQMIDKNSDYSRINESQDTIIEATESVETASEEIDSEVLDAANAENNPIDIRGKAETDSVDEKQASQPNQDKQAMVVNDNVERKNELNEEKIIASNPENGVNDAGAADEKTGNNKESNLSENQNKSDIFEKDSMNSKKTDNENQAGFAVNNHEAIMSKIETLVSEKVLSGGENIQQRIVTQIVNGIKTNVTSEFTSMTLQLEPENLGKINISIVSKAGNITAQIVAQSQVAKEAIESQLSTLKENFENQGLKVDEVEVTVSSHPFEQSFEGNADKNNQQNSKAKKNFSNRFSNDIAEEKEEETVDEQLGNTVSYLA